MDRQATVGNGTVAGDGEAPAQGLKRSFSELAHDVTTLAELQVRLFAVELKQTSQTLKTSAMLLAVGGLLALICLPLLLAGLAWLLVEFAGWPVSAALLTVAIAGLVIGGAVAGIGALRFSRNAALAPRSRLELARNMRWIRNVLSQKGRAPAP